MEQALITRAWSGRFAADIPVSGTTKDLHN
jgi:hypothetical protein